MALWQYTFRIVPLTRAKMIAPDGIVPMEEGVIDDSVCWEGLDFERARFEKVALTLPLGTSWSRELTVYGELDQTCILVFHDVGGKTESMSLRVDFRSSYKPILNRIFAVLRECALVLIDQNGKLMDPVVELAEAAIESAPQISVYEMLSMR